jgi:hypothetical protein
VEAIRLGLLADHFKAVKVDRRLETTLYHLASNASV